MDVASALSAVALAVALLVTGRELEGIATWLVALLASAIVAATLYLIWLWRRTPAQLRIDAEGIHTPALWTGRSRATPWSLVRGCELLRANGRRQIHLHSARNPFAVVLRQAAFQRLPDYDEAIRQLREAVPAQAFFDREHAPLALPYVTVCWLLLLLGCAVAAPILGFDSTTLQQVSFGALQRDLVFSGDWFRLHSFALVHTNMQMLAITLVLTAAASMAIESRLGHLFAAALLTGSNLVAGIALLLFAGPALHTGALGASYGAVGATLVLALAPAHSVPPACRLSIPWWLPLLMLLQLGISTASQSQSYIGALGGGAGGALLTWLHLRATGTDGAESAGTFSQLDRALSWTLSASLALACAALAYASSTMPAQEITARLLQTDVPAGTVLELGESIAQDSSAAQSLQARAFVTLSDPNRVGMAALDSGGTGIRRADTLALLAWRQSMLAEARAHGLDALRRAENETDERQQQLWARLAIYESSARLPAFVPAAVLVRAETLCVLVPKGNPRQYLRAVVTVRGTITGLLLGTVDPGETRCIPANGMPAIAHVALTAAERAVLTSDLRLYTVNPARAALPPRATR